MNKFCSHQAYSLSMVIQHSKHLVTSKIGPELTKCLKTHLIILVGYKTASLLFNIRKLHATLQVQPSFVHMVPRKRKSDLSMFTSPCAIGCLARKKPNFRGVLYGFHNINKHQTNVAAGYNLTILESPL